MPMCGPAELRAAIAVVLVSVEGEDKSSDTVTPRFVAVTLRKAVIKLL